MATACFDNDQFLGLMHLHNTVNSSMVICSEKIAVIISSRATPACSSGMAHN
jgi:hypothetical protein